MQRRHVGVAFLVLLVAVPAAAGSWKAAGSREPDTTFDVAYGRMWTDPDHTSLQMPRKVYFNAFPTAAPTAASPNAALLNGSWMVPGQVRFHALLGVWKDCNRDGYVGHAESALRDYPANTLSDTSVCPFPGKGPLPYNDGRWIHEMIILANPDPCGWLDPVPSWCPVENGASPLVLYTNGTLVWGDSGPPGVPPPQGDCPILPMPAGTTSGTGFLLQYVDCFSHRGVVTAVNAASSAVDPQNAHKLRFDDTRHPQHSSSVLNQQFPANLFGNPKTGKTGLLEQDSDEAAFVVFECTRGTGFSTQDRKLKPAVPHPTGSWWDGALNAQEAVAGDCDSKTNNALRNAYPLFARESPNAGVDAGARSRSSFTFAYHDGDSEGFPPEADPWLGENAPRDLGAGWARTGARATRDSELGPAWTSDPAMLHDGALFRDELQPRGASYYSFYASIQGGDVTRHSLRFPVSSDREYGYEACGSQIGKNKPNRGSWVCDPGLWWRTPEGGDAMPRHASAPGTTGAPLGPVVGQRYQLLDVDCLDGRVAAAPMSGVAPGDGAYASLAPVSADGTCAPIG